MRGFIYVLINPSLEGLVKIGMTTRSTEERCAELSTSSGVPTPFLVVYEEIVNNVAEVEKRIHLYLESLGHRINNKREFFSIPVKVAVKAISEVIKSDPSFLDMNSSDTNEDNPSIVDVSDYEIGDEIYSEALDYILETNGKFYNPEKCMKLTLKAVELGNKKAKTQLANLYQGEAFQCHLSGDINGSNRYKEKATFLLQELVEDDYQTAYGSLLYNYIEDKQYQSIPTLFEIAKKSSCADTILGELNSKVLHSPEASSFGINIDELVEKYYLSTSLCLLTDFFARLNNISSEIDLIHDKIELLLTLTEPCESDLMFSDIEDFMLSKKYDLLATIETKEILEGLIEKYSLNITGDIEVFKDIIETYKTSIADFEELKVTVEFFDFLIILSDAFEEYTDDLNWQEFQNTISITNKIAQLVKNDLFSG